MSTTVLGHVVSLSDMFSYLPEQRITDEDREKFWLYAANEMEQFRNGERTFHDWRRIREIIYSADMSLMDYTMFPRNETAKRIVQALYNIITIFPIESDIVQTEALIMLRLFKEDIDLGIQNLELEWRPIYRFIEAKFSYDSPKLVALLCNDNNVSKPIFSGIEFLSSFFPSSAAQEIIDCMLPHICPRGYRSTFFVVCLSKFMPEKPCNYSEWFKFVVDEVDQFKIPFRLAPLLEFCGKIISGNINDDFNWIIDTLMNTISYGMVNGIIPRIGMPMESIDCTILYNACGLLQLIKASANIVTLLFLSPPTRKAMLGKLEKLMIGAKMAFHPALPRKSAPDLYYFVSYVLNRFSLKMKNVALGVESAKKFADKVPSQDEINMFLKSLLDGYLIMVQHVNFNGPGDLSITMDVRTFIKYYPESINRFFEFAFDCISLVDAEMVAVQGWVMMAAVYASMSQSKVLMDNFQNVFDMAVNSFYMLELQPYLTRFFMISFTQCPFSRQAAPKHLCGLDFSSMAGKVLTAVMDSLRSYPTHDTGFVEIEVAAVYWLDNMFRVLFIGMENDCIKDMFPLIKNLLQDSSYAHIGNTLDRVFEVYALRCDEKSRRTMMKIVHTMLENDRDKMVTRFHLCVYSKLVAICVRTLDEFRERIDFIKTFTHNSENQIRKAAWSSLGMCFAPFDSPHVLIDDEDPALRALSECKVRIYKCQVDSRPLIMEVFGEVMNKLLTCTDAQEIITLMKDIYQALLYPLDETWYVNEEDERAVTPLSWKQSVFYQENRVSNSQVHEFRTKLLDVVYRLMTDFKDNIQIMHQVLYIIRRIFPACPSLDTNSVFSYLLCVWGLDHYEKKYNIFDVAVEISVVYQYRTSRWYIPICPRIYGILEKLFELGTSPYKQIRDDACSVLHRCISFYSTTQYKLCLAKIQNIKQIHVDELLDFLVQPNILDLVMNGECLCHIFSHFLSDLDVQKDETRYLIDSFCVNVANRIVQFCCNQEENDAWKVVIDKLIEASMQNNQKGRSMNLTLCSIIRAAVRVLDEIDPNVIKILLAIGRSEDNMVSTGSLDAIREVLACSDRRSVKCDKHWTLAEYPVLFERTVHSDEKKSDGEINLDLAFKAPPEDVVHHDSIANGWHRYADSTYVRMYKPIYEDIIVPVLPDIFMSLIERNTGPLAGSTVMVSFWMIITRCYGGKVFDVMEKVWNSCCQRNLTPGEVCTMVDYIYGVIEAFDNVSVDDSFRFMEKYVIPLLVNSAKSQEIADLLTNMLTFVSAHIHPIRYQALLRFMWNNMSRSSHLSIMQRNFLTVISNAIWNRCDAVFSSIDVIVDEIITPFLSNISEYDSGYCWSLVRIFVALVASTCVPDHSPLMCPQLSEKREYLLSMLDKALANGDYTNQGFHRFVANILHTCNMLPMQVVKAILPVMIKNMQAIITSLNSSNLVCGRDLISSVKNLLCVPFCGAYVDIALSFLKGLLKHFDLLVQPVQRDILWSVRELIRLSIHAFSAEQMDHVYKMFYKLTTKDSRGNTVLYAIANVLGDISMYMPDMDDMSGMQAASILSVAHLFDEVEPRVLKALKIIANIIETENRSQVAFYQDVVQKFWRNNSGFMTPRVDEALSEYRMLIAPSYIH